MIIVEEAVLLRALQGVIDLFLIPKFNELNMNASGDWIESLTPEVEGEHGVIKGKYYTYWLVNGRQPGTYAPIAPLIRWVGFKLGLSGKDAVSAAYAINNKIKNEGTTHYETQGTDLLDVLKSPEVTQYLYTTIGLSLVGQITLELKRRLWQTIQQ